MFFIVSIQPKGVNNPHKLSFNHPPIDVESSHIVINIQPIDL